MCVCGGAEETIRQEIVWTNSVYIVHFPLPFPLFHSVPPQLLLGGNAETVDISWGWWERRKGTTSAGQDTAVSKLH